MEILKVPVYQKLYFTFYLWCQKIILVTLDDNHQNLIDRKCAVTVCVYMCVCV